MAVDAAFDAYDYEKRGKLEEEQIKHLVNEALKHMGYGRLLSGQ
jgi:hypothetical protein